MKVLAQNWTLSDGSLVTSISKDVAQLNATIKEAATREADEEVLELSGEPYDGNISDESDYIGMIEEGTIFLCDTEMDLVTLH